MTDLIKHVSQVVFGADPGGHSVAEEDEVLQVGGGRRGETSGLMTEPNKQLAAAGNIVVD